MKNFNLDPQFLTSVTIFKEWGMYDGKKEVTDEQLIEILMGKDRCSMISSKDHPEFTKLRDQLENEGYIRTARNYINGDSVIAPFIFNSCIFKTGEQFPSAAAMSGHLRYSKSKNE